MPTVLRSGPYRVYFFSHEPNEPPHVHVDRDEMSAKFWLQPLALARNFGYPPRELRRIRALIEENRENYWRRGMGILALSADERVRAVRVSEDTLTVDLMDGRTKSLFPCFGIRGFSADRRKSDRIGKPAPPDTVFTGWISMRILARRGMARCAATRRFSASPNKPPQATAKHGPRLSNI